MTTKNIEKQGESLYTIEELSKRNGTPLYIFAGICTKNSWGAGKAVTESDYKKEVEAFQKSPIGRRN